MYLNYLINILKWKTAAQLHAHTHTHTYTHIYIYVYVEKEGDRDCTQTDKAFEYL